MTEGVRQRIASSPARTSVANLAIPVHISGGQGLTPPDTTSSCNGNTTNLRASPPPGVAHHRKQLQLSTRLSPSPKVSGTPPMPVYRTLHVAQSHPDLHGQCPYPRPASTFAELPHSLLQPPAVSHYALSARSQHSNPPFPALSDHEEQREDRPQRERHVRATERHQQQLWL